MLRHWSSVTLFTAFLTATAWFNPAPAATFGGVDLGGLTNYLFVFTDGSVDANWQSSSDGYIGDVAVSGGADFRTSGDVPFAGTISTDGTNIGAWQGIVDHNSTTASTSLNNTSLISNLADDFDTALTGLNALSATTNFEDNNGQIWDFSNITNATDLDGLDTTNGTADTIVINITSGTSVNEAINITGDANDQFIIRWAPGEQVKFQSGGGINPLGDLKPSNFVHTAGDINASGGGDTLSGLVDDLAATANTDILLGGNVIDGGGFFTGYWLTTGDADGETSSFSNAIFVGGWYTSTSKFSMTSGTSGVYVAPVPIPASLSLFLTALAGLGGFGFIKRRGKHILTKS